MPKGPKSIDGYSKIAMALRELKLDPPIKSIYHAFP